MALAETVSLPSGAKLVLNDPPFETSMALFQAVASELMKIDTGIKIDLNFASDPDALRKLLGGIDLPVDVLKNAVCQMIASKAVEGLLRECMGRCLYDGKSATQEMFEPRNARQDYLPVAWEVMKFNLLPFFAGLKSKSLTGAGGTGGPPR